MPDGHCADPSLPLHLYQGRGSSKKESFSLRVSPALHPPERPSPRRADMAGHGHGSGDAGTENLLVNIKVLSQLSFLFLPLTKLPHPNTIYRISGHGVGSGVLALEHVLSRAKGAIYTFVSRDGGVQNFTGHPWPKGDGKSE